MYFVFYNHNNTHLRVNESVYGNYICVLKNVVSICLPFFALCSEFLSNTDHSGVNQSIQRAFRILLQVRKEAVSRCTSLALRNLRKS